MGVACGLNCIKGCVWGRCKRERGRIEEASVCAHERENVRMREQVCVCVRVYMFVLVIAPLLDSRCWYIYVRIS